MSLSVVEVLEQLGGVARRRTLLALVDRQAVDRALLAGDIVRVGRRLALAGGDESVRCAIVVGGVLGLTDAALHHGWAIKTQPKVPSVVVSRGRRVPEDAPSAVLLRAELGTRDVVDVHWTAQETTLDHCLRRLPFDEALCVADSALREGFGRIRLQEMADAARGPGSAQFRRVVAQATHLAANPFESTARAIGLDVPGLALVPQVVLPDLGYRADLVDIALRIVVECESFEWHTKRAAFASDCRRYTAMTSHGWIVLRLCYEDVMSNPEVVREALAATVAHARMLNKGLAALRSAA